jgi:hypothetical protein
VAGHPVDLGFAADRDLDGIARPQVVEVAKDISLDVVVPVEEGVAGPKRGRLAVSRDRVTGGDQHQALGVERSIVDGGVADADPRNRDAGATVGAAVGDGDRVVVTIASTLRDVATW